MVLFRFSTTFFILLKISLLDNINYSSYFSQFRSIGSSSALKCGGQCTCAEETETMDIFQYFLCLHLLICYYYGIAVLYQRKKQTKKPQNKILALCITVGPTSSWDIGISLCKSHWPLQLQCVTLSALQQVRLCQCHRWGRRWCVRCVFSQLSSGPAESPLQLSARSHHSLMSEWHLLGARVTQRCHPPHVTGRGCHASHPSIYSSLHPSIHPISKYDVTQKISLTVL